MTNQRAKIAREASFESRLLTAPDIARILNLNKGSGYKLIKLKEISSFRINRNVKEIY